MERQPPSTAENMWNCTAKPSLGHVFDNMQDMGTCRLLRAEHFMPVHGVLTGHLLLVLHIILPPHHEGCGVCFLPALYAIHPTYAWRLLLQVKLCDIRHSLCVLQFLPLMQC